MKKLLIIIVSVCIAFTFISCAKTKNQEITNPYQVNEEITKIKESFNDNLNDIEKIVVKIADTETEIDKNDSLLNLFIEANSTVDEPSEQLSTVVAYIRIYYTNGNIVEYGRIYTDSDGNIYLVSNYNQNENKALKITDESVMFELILPNVNLF